MPFLLPTYVVKSGCQVTALLACDPLFQTYTLEPRFQFIAKRLYYFI